jgi:hypothetical protein
MLGVRFGAFEGPGKQVIPTFDILLRMIFLSASRLVYGVTIFLGASLLFLVEPMAAKELLPVLGGSSAVWLTCLVFFQVTLLLGYLYAHWLARSPSSGWQQRIYVALLGVAVILLAARPLLHTIRGAGSSHPVTTIFVALGLTIGLPFLLLASTSPLLQLWLLRSESGTKDHKVPYRLFALSNAGSLLALLAYPTLVEPHLTLKLQRSLWTVGFVVYAMLCTWLSRQRRLPIEQVAAPELTDGPPTPERIKWLWFLLPMGAAMQLSAVTGHLTVNIAAIPLLWMLPLAVYLLSFILAFEAPVLYRRGLVVRFLVVLLASLGYAISKTDVTLPIGVGIAFFLVECFLACLFCHAEAYALRPRRPSETTLFYLLIAAGGAAGTFFVGILSPLVFSANYDLAIAFLVTAVLAVAVTWQDGWPQRLLWSTCSVLLLAFAVLLHAAYGREAILEVRNFYGTLRVKQSATEQGNTMRMLLNGAIQHGTQLFSPSLPTSSLSRIPTTYYAENSGVGLALRLCCEGRSRNVGVIGLGTGTLAAYGRPGDRVRFYEINPLVRPIAQNLFTYLRDSGAKITYADGDARTSLTGEAPQGFDVLAVDAFSGDAIPLHLLTTEALELYRKHLAPNGILAFHVSNQYLDLAPEIGLLADSAGMQARLVDSSSDEPHGIYRSTWVLLTASPTFFVQPAVADAAGPVPAMHGLRAWTDDYSSLLPILQLGAH